MKIETRVALIIKEYENENKYLIKGVEMKSSIIIPLFLVESTWDKIHKTELLFLRGELIRKGELQEEPSARYYVVLNVEAKSVPTDMITALVFNKSNEVTIELDELSNLLHYEIK